MESNTEFRIQFKLDVDEEFWAGLKILWSNDGMSAILVTPQKKYMIRVDSEREDYGKVMNLAKYQDAQIEVFCHGTSDFLIVLKDMKKQRMTFASTGEDAETFDKIKLAMKP